MTPSMRQWTPAEIEDSLNLAARLPDFPDNMAKFVRMSAQTAQHHPACKIAGGPDAADYALHLRPTNAVAGRPVFVFIHGGYWRFSCAEDFLFVGDPFLRRGMDFVSINYPLCPGVSFEQLVESTLATIARVRQAFAGRTLWIGGHSAGAHLAALACALPQGARDMQSGPIEKALLISGLYDLAPVQASFLQGILGVRDEDRERYSPLFQRWNGDIDYQIVVGDLETPIFKTQADDLQQVLASACSASLHRILERDHFNLLFSLFAPDGKLLEAWLDL